MSQEGDLSLFLLEALETRCSQETRRFYRGEPSDTRYCFEIFRRAFLQRDDQAWELIYRLYSMQIIRWVRRHPAFQSLSEDEEYLANRILEKLWQAVTPEKFGGFSELKALLAYMQMCVHSVLTDHARALSQEKLEQHAGIEHLVSGTENLNVEDRVIARAEAARRWQAVLERMNDLREERVAFDTFVLGVKPRETLARFPTLFKSVSQIYRIKENILDRLRRDPEFLKLVAPDAEEIS